MSEETATVTPIRPEDDRSVNEHIVAHYLQDPEVPSWHIAGTGSVLALDSLTLTTSTEVDHRSGSDVTTSVQTTHMHIRVMGSRPPALSFGDHVGLHAEKVTLIVDSRRDHDETTTDIILVVDVIDLRKSPFAVQWSTKPGTPFGVLGVRRQEPLSKSPKWLRDAIHEATGVALDEHFAV